MTAQMTRNVLLISGAVLLLAALVWRLRVVASRRRRVEVALRSPDVTVRTRALRQISAVGLRPYARFLLRRTVEVDAGVAAGIDDTVPAEADELAWVIATCQWEPADEPALVQLRIWAQQHHERRREAPTAALSAPVATAPPAAQPAASAVAVVPAVPAETRDLVAAAESVLGQRVVSLRFRPARVSSTVPSS